MSNWKTVRLGDIAKDGRGYYGIGASAVPFSPEKYTYLRITDINDDGTLNKADLKSVDAENAENYLLSPNDVVFARTGNSTGRNYFYDGKDGKFVYAGFLIKFSIDNEKINPKYVKYFLRTKEYWDWISSFNTGSTRGNINAQTYANLEIPLLSPKQQNLIAEVLGALDDKIECNNRINRTLEEQAAVLFRRWFVDFEFPDPDPTSPTYGKPYCSAGGTMQDSPLGSIPKGWKVGRLSDCAAYISRGITPKYVEIGKEIVLNQKCIRNHDVSFNESRFHTPKVINDKWLKFGDILINSTGQGTLGRVAQFFYNNNNVTVDSHVSIVRPIADNYIHFIGQALIGREAEIESMAAGSTGQTELPRERLNNMEIIMPDNTVLNRFHTAISPFMKMKIKNRLENQALKGLRDTLLPKLMNNEITI